MELLFSHMGGNPSFRGPGGPLRGPGFGPAFVGGPRWGIGVFLFIVLVGLLIALSVLMILNLRRLPKTGPAPAQASTPTPTDPLEVARLRYARGEVNRDEYLSLVNDLTRQESSPPGG